MGGTIFTAIADALAVPIRKGQPIALLGGALVGALAGGLAGLINSLLIGPFGVLCALLGAAVAGWLFPRPPRMIAPIDERNSGHACGNIEQLWCCRFGDSRAITVLMENAIYTACKEGLQLQEVVDPLVQGVDPGLPGAALIPLRHFESIEFFRSDDQEIVLLSRLGNRLRRSHLAFATLRDRREFLSAIQRRLRLRLVCDHVEVGFGRAIAIPGLCFLLLAMVFGGLAWLAAYWQAFPPPNPIGQATPAAFVFLLTWAGPVNVLLVAAPLIIAAGMWLAVRGACRPRIFRLTPTQTLISAADWDELAPPDPLSDLDTAEQKREAALARSARWTAVLKLIAVVQFVLYLVILGFRLTPVFLELAGERSALERQRLRHDVDAVRQAVREGKAGEATSRLFPQEHQ